MHKKDSIFEMNIYYFHFFEIQSKSQDLRLYYSTAHLVYDHGAQWNEIWLYFLYLCSILGS